MPVKEASSEETAYADWPGEYEPVRAFLGRSARLERLLRGRGHAPSWGNLPVSPDPFHRPLRGHRFAMGREGFEPSTLGLRVPCSTS